VGSPRLTCGHHPSQSPFAQVSPKREDLTGFLKVRSNEKRQTKSQDSGLGAFFVFRADGAAADSGRLTCLTCPPPALEGSNPLP
jgi:hypothetical protein